MKLTSFSLLVAFASTVALAQPGPQPNVANGIAKVLSRGDGASEKTAFKVRSVHEEYEILAALGLTPGVQSLVLKDKPYDHFETTDPRTGARREIWFDISAFYPEF